MLSPSVSPSDSQNAAMDAPNPPEAAVFEGDVVEGAADDCALEVEGVGADAGLLDLLGDDCVA